MRREWVSLVNDFWMPLVKHWDLSKDKPYNFKHTTIMPQTRPSFYMYTLYKLMVCTCLKDHNKDNDLICMNYLLLDVKQQTLKISKFPNYLRIYYFQYDGLILAFKRPEKGCSRNANILKTTYSVDCCFGNYKMDENSRPRKQARLDTFRIPRRDEKSQR